MMTAASLRGGIRGAQGVETADRGVPYPEGADWSWRPESWRTPPTAPGFARISNKFNIEQDVTLFHDCPDPEISLRRIRNLRASELAAWGLRLDVFRFGGSYLSLAVDLPEAASAGLGRSHLMRVETIVEMEHPIEIYARLNVRHGPNTERIVRALPPGAREMRAEFDLSDTRLDERRVERMWLDLIFEKPEMNQVILRDLTFSRRPRAEL